MRLEALLRQRVGHELGIVGGVRARMEILSHAILAMHGDTHGFLGTHLGVQQQWGRCRAGAVRRVLLTHVLLVLLLLLLLLERNAAGSGSERCGRHEGHRAHEQGCRHARMYSAAPTAT